MHDAYESWVMILAGWALALAAGGYVVVARPGRLVTRPYPWADRAQGATRGRWPASWPDTLVSTLSLVLIVTGGSHLQRSGSGDFAVLLLVPALVRRFLPVWVNNARIPGHFRFALPYDGPPAEPPVRTPPSDSP